MNDNRTTGFIKALNELVCPKGLSPAYLSKDEYPVVILDDLYETSAPYVFEGCTDSQAKFFLRSFLAGSPLCEWELACQLAKLAATRGALVMQEAIAVVDGEDWSGINPRQLLLSFIATFPDFKARLPELLENSLSDFRDGLFIACREADNPEVDQILLSQFKKWERSGDWPESGTGESAWREFFIKRRMGGAQ